MKNRIYKVEVFGKNEIGEINSVSHESKNKIEKETLNKIIHDACYELSGNGYNSTGFVVKESKTYKII